VIGAAVLIAIGIIAGQFFPLKFREWVRALAGKARGLVLGAAPASNLRYNVGASSAAPTGDNPSPVEVRPAPPNKPIKGFLSGLMNIGLFVVKNPLLIAGCFIVIAIFMLATGAIRLPFGDWGKSRDTLRAERDGERINAAVAKNERDLAAYALELADRTHGRTQAANQAVIDGQQDLANAVANLPPMVGEEHFADLQRRYADAYERVLRAAGFEGEPNPDPRRSAPLRSAPANAA